MSDIETPPPVAVAAPQEQVAPEREVIPAEEDFPGEVQMSLVDHLEELRRRIMRSLLAVV
ncbi:MAG: twin-arginine translocase subunit TatC, partial [Cyanobacteriota bacterium]